MGNFSAIEKQLIIQFAQYIVYQWGVLISWVTITTKLSSFSSKLLTYLARQKLVFRGRQIRNYDMQISHYTGKLSQYGRQLNYYNLVSNVCNLSIMVNQLINYYKQHICILPVMPTMPSVLLLQSQYKVESLILKRREYYLYHYELTYHRCSVAYSTMKIAYHNF